jgi:hypothetical protein
MGLDDLMTFIPHVGSGDYLARSKNAKQSGYDLRKSILKITVDIFHRMKVMETINLFLSELFDVSFMLKVKYVFLRFYNSESESKGLRWHVEGSLAIGLPVGCTIQGSQMRIACTCTRRVSGRTTASEISCPQPAAKTKCPAS